MVGGRGGEGGARVVGEGFLRWGHRLHDWLQTHRQSSWDGERVGSGVGTEVGV